MDMAVQQTLPFFAKSGSGLWDYHGADCLWASCTRAECLVGGDNLPTTDSLGLGLPTYCGMVIVTLAAARDPMIRLLHRWEMVSHWPHIIVAWSTGVPKPSRCGRGSEFSGMGGASHPYRKSLEAELLRKGFATRVKKQLYVVHVPCYVSMMA